VIRENILKIKEKIVSSCAKANRLSSEVTLVGVSKNRSLEDIQEVLAAGIRDIGENKVQEALKHQNALSNITWHMVGHLQTNKVKEAVKLFDLIHSVDSLRLAEEINSQASRNSKAQDILIEVNTSAEESKFGINPAQLEGLVKAISELKNVRLLGLMTMAPEGDDPEKARPYFRRLKELLVEVNALPTMNYRLRTLSMGMSDDFQVAIEEGATMVRIGRAIFEGAGL
jgi:PLP dependent protein